MKKWVREELIEAVKFFMPSPRAPEETEYRILKASVIMYWIDGSCTYHCTWTLKDQLQQRACMCSRRWRWEYGLGVHRSHRMVCCFEVCAYTTSQTLQARWVISAYQSCGLLGENVVVLGWKEVQYKWHIKAAVRGNEKTITSDLLCEGSLERRNQDRPKGRGLKVLAGGGSKADRAATSFAFTTALS